MFVTNALVSDKSRVSIEYESHFHSVYSFPLPLFLFMIEGYEVNDMIFGQLHTVNEQKKNNKHTYRIKYIFISLVDINFCL